MLKLSDIQGLIEAGESDVLEWKKSTAQLQRAGETLCAFLNGSGGTVLIGVGDRGELQGQEVSDKTRLDLSRTIYNIEPDAQVTLQEIRLPNGRYLIALVADPDPNLQPYLFRGRAYERIGPATLQMGHERLTRLVYARPENESRWEWRVASGWSIEDLEAKEIIRVAKLGIEFGRIPSDVSLEPEDLLRGFKLLTSDGRVTNAAAVLFAGSGFTNERLLQSSLRLARFNGTDKSEFLDQALVQGGAFHLLSQAVSFIRRHLPVAAKVVPEQLEIQQTPLIPSNALRETLINALVHRDYSDQAGGVSVAIFDDRLEIQNAGGLPLSLDLDSLRTEHPSVPRNPLIAGVFYQMGLIESWGRGTLKTIELCKEAGLSEPEFEERENHFRVIFRAPFTPATQGVAIKADGLVVSELQSQILAELTPDEKLSMRHLVERIEANERAIQRGLRGLIELGLVKRQGQGRATRYLRVENPDK